MPMFGPQVLEAKKNGPNGSSNRVQIEIIRRIGQNGQSLGTWTSIIWNSIFRANLPGSGPQVTSARVLLA